MSHLYLSYVPYLSDAGDFVYPNGTQDWEGDDSSLSPTSTASPLSGVSLESQDSSQTEKIESSQETDDVVTKKAKVDKEKAAARSQRQKKSRADRYKNASPTVQARRRAQNRASQRAYRARKDQRIKTLEVELKQANERIKSLVQSCAVLMRTVSDPAAKAASAAAASAIATAQPTSVSLPNLLDAGDAPHDDLLMLPEMAFCTTGPVDSCFYK